MQNSSVVNKRKVANARSQSRSGNNGISATVSLPFNKGGVAPRPKPISTGRGASFPQASRGGKSSIVKRKQPSKFQLFFGKIQKNLSGNSQVDKTGLKVKNAKNRKAPKALRTIAFIFGAIIIVLLVTFTGYSGIQRVLEIRAQNNATEVDLTKLVIGYDDVPVFPGSEYIYKGLDDNELVQKTLNSGVAIYRLPYGSKVDDVFKFYSTYLPQMNWEYIQTAPLTSPDMMYGQYWRNDGKGIRIYSRLNDIWYEKVSVEEADTGLAQRKTEIIEREQVLNQDELQTLLPAYPWQLYVTGEYLIEYFTPDISDTIGISFRHLITNQRTFLDPIGKTSTQPEDLQVEKYLENYNLYLVQAKQNSTAQGSAVSQDNYNPWKIVNSFYTQKYGYDMLQIAITNGSLSSNAYTLRNQNDGITYIVVSFDADSTFTEYLLENIKDKYGLTPDQVLKIIDE